MSKEIGKNIVGTWSLVSWEAVDESGNREDAFGKNPTGILMYDTFGYMNAQLMKSERTNFSSDVLHEGSSDEIVAAYKSYACYYGKYEEVEPGKYIHEVEGSLFPNWVNGNEIRFGRLEGDCLYLSTSPIHMNGKKLYFEVKWERIKT